MVSIEWVLFLPLGSYNIFDSNSKSNYFIIQEIYQTIAPSFSVFLVSQFFQTCIPIFSMLAGLFGQHGQDLRSLHFS